MTCTVYSVFKNLLFAVDVEKNSAFASFLIAHTSFDQFLSYLFEQRFFKQRDSFSR